MAKLNVPITKTAYLNLKRELSFAEEGFTLLEQKREILVLELIRLLHNVGRVQREVVEKLERAFAALRRAMLEMGAFALKKQALHAVYNHEIQIEEHRLMGINMPTTRGRHEEFQPKFSLAEGSAATDEVMRCFLDALKSIDALAQIQASVVRLARETKKTQRRVNALEKIFLPNFRETIDYIASTLEEREREALFVMKMVKERLSSDKTAR